MPRQHVCEVVVVSRTKHPKEVVCSIDQQQLIPKDAAICLGFWWSWNLAAKMAVDEAMKKARHAFFLFGGMSAFRGDLITVWYELRLPLQEESAVCMQTYQQCVCVIIHVPE